MATMTQHAPGTFCWPELATNDVEGAKRFYTMLFGWTYVDNPMGEGGVYTMLKLRDADVGALYQLSKEQREQKLPPYWSAYVSVESADAAAEKTRQSGGKVLMEPMDVMEHGRMAVLQDPTGAVFCAWQPRKHIGATVLDEPGSLCWTELLTPDPEAARKFYTAILPWTHETMSMEQGDYVVFKRGESNAAGMMKMPAGAPAPPHWLSYFAVEDADTTSAKAMELGGKVVVPPTNIPNVGRFSVLQDPQGAYFALLGPEK